MDDATPKMTAEELDSSIAKTTAPKVTREQIKARIKGVVFHRLTPTLTTAIIKLDNGYTVTGESACVSPENYDQAIGEKISYDNAFEHLWPLFGFLLAERLHTEKREPLTFGGALKALHNGQRVARAGWNGKGMFLYLVPAASYKAQTDAARAEFGEMVPYGAYIAMKTAQDNVVPWLASQTDVLADDWVNLDIPQA